jgi:uncharacterized protein
MKQIILKIIKLYQHTLSLDHGPLKFLRPYGQCKFYPSCSEYAYKAITRKGITLGGFLSLKRILKCNPLGTGGIDEIK